MSLLLIVTMINFFVHIHVFLYEIYYLIYICMCEKALDNYFKTVQ